MNRHKINLTEGMHVDEVAGGLLAWLQGAAPCGGAIFDRTTEDEFLGYLGPGEHIEVTHVVESYRIGTADAGILVRRFLESWRRWNPASVQLQPPTWRVVSYGGLAGAFAATIDRWEVVVSWAEDAAWCSVGDVERALTNPVPLIREGTA